MKQKRRQARGHEVANAAPGQQDTSFLLSLKFFRRFSLLLYLLAKEISLEVWLILILAFTRQFIISLCKHFSI